MMPLRTRIFIIISLVVLCILGVSIFLLIKSRQSNNTETTTTTNGEGTTFTEAGLVPATVVEVTTISDNVTALPISVLETEQNGVTAIARTFLERYNSFSSDSKYQNVRDVKELVTNNYWNKLSKSITSSNQTQNNDAFYSIITKVYGSKLEVWEANSVEISLETKISEEKNGVISNRNQAALVKLLKENGNWLVDGFVWQK